MYYSLKAVNLSINFFKLSFDNSVLFNYYTTHQMFLHLDSASGIPIYRQLVNQIRQRIVSAQLPVGEKLPSARELSKQLRLNMLTVNKAYQHLEALELVETRRGLGTFVLALKAIQPLSTTDAITQPSVRKS